jgi:hypothetical protein
MGIRQKCRLAPTIDKINLGATKTVVFPLGSLETNTGRGLIAVVRWVRTCEAVARWQQPSFVARTPSIRLANLIIDVFKGRPKPIWQVLGRYVQCRKPVESCLVGGLDLDPMIPGFVGLSDFTPLSFDFLSRQWEFDSRPTGSK